MANATSSTYPAVAAFLVTLIITFGIQYVAPNSEISNRYPTPLTPPGWTFSIWGIIFTLQAGMLALFTLEPAGTKQVPPMQWLVAGWLSESVWQLLFALETPISLALCAPVLIFGAFAFIRALLALSDAGIDSGIDNIDIADQDSSPAAANVLLIISTAVNAAWLTVAAALAVLVAFAANSSATLVPFAAALAVVVAAIGATVTIREGSVAYSLTLMWAFWGVHVKNGDGKLVDSLALACSVLFGLLSIIVVIMIMVRRSRGSSRNDGAAEGDALLQPGART